MIKFLIILFFSSFTFVFAQAQEHKTKDVEAIGYIDAASKSVKNNWSKSDLFLYDGSKKNAYYPLTFSNNKIHEDLLKFKGKLVKIKGKLVFNEILAGEKKNTYTTISVDEAQEVKLFNNFITDDVAYNKLYLPNETTKTQTNEKSSGVSIPSGAANALIFIGGAALVGKMVHDAVSWRKENYKK